MFSKSEKGDSKDVFLEEGTVWQYCFQLYWTVKNTWFWQPAIRDYNLLSFSGDSDLYGQKKNYFYYEVLFCRITWPVPFLRQHRTESRGVDSWGDFCCCSTNLCSSLFFIPRKLGELIILKQVYKFCHQHLDLIYT